MAMRRTLPSLVRRIAPWLVAAFMLAWLFRMVQLDQLQLAVARAPLGLFAVVIATYVLGTLFGDTFATWATFRWALPEAGLRFREALDVRGASYLLAIIHYGAGQGSLAYFVSRVHKIPLARVAGAVMLIMGVNVVVVALFAFLGVVLGGGPDDPMLRWIVLGLACSFPAYLAIIAARPNFLMRIRLLQPLFDAGLRGHAVATLARLPHISWLLLGNYVAMRLFNVDPPIVVAISLLPIVFVVTVLPISPGGLGTAQAVTLALFAPYAAGATVDARRASVLAFSLAMQFAGLIVQAAIGLVFLRRVSRAVTLDEKPADGL